MSQEKRTNPTTKTPVEGTETSERETCTETCETQCDGNRCIGQVKWFSNQLCYGFITIKREDGTEEDVFVHKDHIKPSHSQYRTLQQGEYVSFHLGTADSSSEETQGMTHQHQAIDVRGANGGSLMCDQVRQGTRFQRGRGPRMGDSGNRNSGRFDRPREQSENWQSVRRERRPRTQAEDA